MNRTSDEVTERRPTENRWVRLRQSALRQAGQAHGSHGAGTVPLALGGGERQGEADSQVLASCVM